ncbi:hypothetical protein OPIT5_08220 [Opitutaceae bacterium TAV5]|nr:hypothetical protein OPIT5_08220 [Opitutaceae bacterium TAV5]
MNDDDNPLGLDIGTRMICVRRNEGAYVASTTGWRRNTSSMVSARVAAERLAVLLFDVPDTSTLHIKEIAPAIFIAERKGAA